MTTKHTSGPWRAEGYENLVVNSGEGYTIVATPGGGPCAPLSELKANARLIAAAPDLLAALELVYEAMIHNPGFSAPYKGRDGWEFSPEGKARAAIAKATGGSL